jgi:hypothetical protein
VLRAAGLLRTQAAELRRLKGGVDVIAEASAYLENDPTTLTGGNHEG